MQTKKQSQFDKRWIGLLSGILLPILVILVFYLNCNQKNLNLFWSQIVSVNILSRAISLCVVPNLGLFFIFIWKNMLKSAYGVVGATFIYAFVVLILTNF